MQGLLGLLFPVALMLFALAMERIETVSTKREPQPAVAGDDTTDDAPDVETLATIGLPKAVEHLDLDLDREDGRRAS